MIAEVHSWSCPPPHTRSLSGKSQLSQEGSSDSTAGQQDSSAPILHAAQKSLKLKCSSSRVLEREKETNLKPKSGQHSVLLTLHFTPVSRHEMQCLFARGEGCSEVFLTFHYPPGLYAFRFLKLYESESGIHYLLLFLAWQEIILKQVVFKIKTMFAQAEAAEQSRVVSTQVKVFCLSSTVDSTFPFPF